MLTGVPLGINPYTSALVAQVQPLSPDLGRLQPSRIVSSLGLIAQPCPNDLRNLPCGNLRIFVFPDSYDQPARGGEPVVRVLIALAVCLDLVSPEGRVALWPSSMVRTAVPKASVDEDGNSRSSKRDVGRPSRLLGHDIVHPESQTHSMQALPQADLCRSVALSSAGHSTSSGVGRCGWNVNAQGSTCSLTLSDLLACAEPPSP
jgi:hypothetical protein